MIRHWHELVGYIIQPRRHLPIIPILFGRGDNGKTKLLHTVMQLLGPALVHAQRVEDLDKSRFAMGSLFGKFLFVDDDVRARARLPDGILKTISEAKEVTGELKFGPVFNFTVRAVPVLLCNNIPCLADLSHGMRRRLMVIPFDRTFTKMDKDPELFDRIVANELPGVLNRALAATAAFWFGAASNSHPPLKSPRPGGSNTPTPYRRSSKPVALSILKPSAGLLTFMLRTRNGPDRWDTRQSRPSRPSASISRTSGLKRRPPAEER